MEALSMEALVSICEEMDIPSLEKLLMSTFRNYKFCYEVYLKKKRVITLRNKESILRRSNQANQKGKVLDVSQISTDKFSRIGDIVGMKIIMPLPKYNGKMLIPNTNIIVTPERYDEIVRILNTV